MHYACHQERRRCRRRLLCPVQLLIMWHQLALSLMKEPHSLDLSSRLPNTRRSGGNRDEGPAADAILAMAVSTGPQEAGQNHFCG